MTATKGTRRKPVSVRCVLCGDVVTGCELKPGQDYRCWPKCGASWFSSVPPPPAPKPKHAPVAEEEPEGWWTD